MNDIDEPDQSIFADRVASLNAIVGPRVGDFIQFADNITRRVSHIWDFGEDAPRLAQTSDGGSYYLGDGYVCMSGGLFPSVPMETLTLVPNEPREGRCWFFHHDHHRAHNGVEVCVQFRLFTCSLPAPR